MSSHIQHNPIQPTDTAMPSASPSKAAAVVTQKSPLQQTVPFASATSPLSSPSSGDEGAQDDEDGDEEENEDGNEDKEEDEEQAGHEEEESSLTDKQKLNAAECMAAPEGQNGKAWEAAHRAEHPIYGTLDRVKAFIAILPANTSLQPPCHARDEMFPNAMSQRGFKEYILTEQGVEHGIVHVSKRTMNICRLQGPEAGKVRGRKRENDCNDHQHSWPAFVYTHKAAECLASTQNKRATLIYRLVGKACLDCFQRGRSHCAVADEGKLNKDTAKTAKNTLDWTKILADQRPYRAAMAKIPPSNLPGAGGNDSGKGKGVDKGKGPDRTGGKDTGNEPSGDTSQSRKRKAEANDDTITPRPTIRRATGRVARADVFGVDMGGDGVAGPGPSTSRTFEMRSEARARADSADNSNDPAEGQEYDPNVPMSPKSDLPGEQENDAMNVFRSRMKFAKRRAVVGEEGDEERRASLDALLTRNVPEGLQGAARMVHLWTRDLNGFVGQQEARLLAAQTAAAQAQRAHDDMGEEVNVHARNPGRMQSRLDGMVETEKELRCLLGERDEEIAALNRRLQKGAFVSGSVERFAAVSGLRRVPGDANLSQSAHLQGCILDLEAELTRRDHVAQNPPVQHLLSDLSSLRRIVGRLEMEKREMQTRIDSDSRMLEELRINWHLEMKEVDRLKARNKKLEEKLEWERKSAWHMCRVAAGMSEAAADQESDDENDSSSSSDSSSESDDSEDESKDESEDDSESEDDDDNGDGDEGDNENDDDEGDDDERPDAGAGVYGRHDERYGRGEYNDGADQDSFRDAEEPRSAPNAGVSVAGDGVYGGIEHAEVTRADATGSVIETSGGDVDMADDRMLLGHGNERSGLDGAACACEVCECFRSSVLCSCLCCSDTCQGPMESAKAGAPGQVRAEDVDVCVDELGDNNLQLGAQLQSVPAEPEVSHTDEGFPPSGTTTSRHVSSSAAPNSNANPMTSASTASVVRGENPSVAAEATETPSDTAGGPHATSPASLPGRQPNDSATASATTPPPPAPSLPLPPPSPVAPQRTPSPAPVPARGAQDAAGLPTPRRRRNAMELLLEEAGGHGTERASRR